MVVLFFCPERQAVNREQTKSSSLLLRLLLCKSKNHFREPRTANDLSPYQPLLLLLLLLLRYGLVGLLLKIPTLDDVGALQTQGPHAKRYAVCVPTRALVTPFRGTLD